MGSSQVGHIGWLVHAGADAVSGVFPDYAVAASRTLDMALDGMADVTHPARHRSPGDTGPHGQPGGLDQFGSGRGWRADHEGTRRVPMPAVHDGPEVDRDHIAVGQCPISRDTVHHHLIDRDAHGRRIGRESPFRPIAEK